MLFYCSERRQSGGSDEGVAGAERISRGLSLSVFVTGNTIYMVGHRIASQMVAQDARNKTQSFRQVRTLGGGKTLRPVCGCIIPVFRCALGLLEVLVVR